MHITFSFRLDLFSCKCNNNLLDGTVNDQCKIKKGYFKVATINNFFHLIFWLIIGSNNAQDFT